MTASTLCKASELTAGDLVTESDTPEGPFYVVLKTNPKSVLVDAAFDGDEPLPIRLPIRASDMVRKARA